MALVHKLRGLTMMRFNLFFRTVVRLMPAATHHHQQTTAAVMVMLSMPIGYAQAGMVSTDQVIDAAAMAETREQVFEFLARDDVRQQMEMLGVDPDEASLRAASMTDAEVMQLAGQLEQLPAGEGLGAILGAVVLIFVILLITDILGLTNIFPFVR